jgi:hypothetical protein
MISKQFKRDLCRRVTFKRDSEPSGIYPAAAEYQDFGSKKRNTCVTSGSIGTLRGEHLKANLQNPDEGVFFVARSTGDAIRVKMFSRNVSKELTFLVPPLILGEVYRLEVLVRPRQVKTLLECRLDKPLACTGN